MADNFSEWRAGLESPAEHAVEITPSDSTDLAISTRGLYVGASGDVTLDTVGGETVTFVGLAAGIIHPIRARRVRATGTDATGIVGVY
jgi:hypothetical protein